MGSFYKSLKIEKTITYTFCWTEILPKKIWEVFWVGGFGVCYIRMFYKFSGWSLWTNVAHENKVLVELNQH